MIAVVKQAVARANAAIADRRGFVCVKRPLPFATVDAYIAARNRWSLVEALKEAGLSCSR